MESLNRMESLRIKFHINPNNSIDHIQKRKCQLVIFYFLLSFLFIYFIFFFFFLEMMKRILWINKKETHKENRTYIILTP